MSERMEEIMNEEDVKNQEQAKPEAQAQEKVLKMYRWQNVSGTTLTVTEGMITVPNTGYTPPMMVPTPSLRALEDAGLMKKSEVAIAEMPAGSVRALAAGDRSTDAPCNQDRVVVAGPQYLPPVVTSGVEKLKNYVDPQNPVSTKVREAAANCVVSIGDGATAAISSGDNINPEQVASIVKMNKNKFSTEVTVGDYVKDEAQKAIDSMRSRSVVAERPVEGVVPEGIPAEYHSFFKLTHLQKKIAIFKNSDSEYLRRVKGYERDATVVSCISQRLGELGVAD
jgi:hypothetical protein